MQNKNMDQELKPFFSAIRQALNETHGNQNSQNLQKFLFGILFYRFVSESMNFCANMKENEAGNSKFRYSSLSDNKAEHFRDLILAEKGFFIYPSELFENVRKMKGSDKNLSETLTAIFKNIEASTQCAKHNESLRGLFDFLIVKDSIPNKILRKLMDAIGDMLPIDYVNDFPQFYGDSFELMMKKFIPKPVNLSGNYFTPQEVSELLVRIAVAGKSKVDKVYDPACGSGALLLKFVEVLGKENVSNGFFGQDIDISNYNFCRLNMLLHNINFKQFDVACGNTLTEPHHTNFQPFEAIVSDPPYSCYWEADSNPELIKDVRFSPAGFLAPQTSSDFAFIMHSLAWLATNGTAAVVAYPGAMYRKGRELRIRKYLIESNFVDAVIQLPIHLNVGSPIAFCIFVMKKSKTDCKVLFIDASGEYETGSGRNRLNNGHLKKIVDCYVNREDCEQFAKLVENGEIAENNFNLSVGTYIEPKHYHEKIDIDDLNSEIEAIVSRQSKLRTEVNASIVDLKEVFA